MLAVLIYITDSVRRALRKFGRGVLIVAESFEEARKIRRAMPRCYIED